MWRFLQPVITLGVYVGFTLGSAPHFPCSQGMGTTFNLQHEADPTHRLRWRVNGSQSRPGWHPSHRGSHPAPVVSTAPSGPVSFFAAPSLSSTFLGHGVEAFTLHAAVLKTQRLHTRTQTQPDMSAQVSLSSQPRLKLGLTICPLFLKIRHVISSILARLNS